MDSAAKWCLAFAEHGADVIIASRKLDNCEKLANEVRERFGAQGIAGRSQCRRLEPVRR